jgi:hypothetical protein
MDNRLEIIEGIISKEDISKIIPDINYGGCGVFAHALGKQLNQKNIDNKIIGLGTLLRIECGPDEMIEKTYKYHSELTAETLHRTGADVMHLMVEVEVDSRFYLVDSTGIYEDINRHPLFGERNLKIDTRMTVDECGILASNAKGWNSRFDRSFIPKIYDFIRSRTTEVFEKQLYTQLKFEL